MKTFSYLEAMQNFSALLNIAKHEEVEILRDGVIFSLTSKKKEKKSPFDVLGIKTKATTEDILEAVSATRSR